MPQSDPGPRSLAAPWPLVFRLVFGLVLAASLFLLFIGIVPFFESYTVGYIGISMNANPSGEVVLEVTANSYAEAAGLVSGDILLTVNGQPAAGTEAARAAQIKGLVGEPLTVSVRKADGSEKAYTIVRSENYSNNILAAGLTPNFLARYFSVLSVLTVLVFAILGTTLLLRRAKDWLFVIAGFTLLFFPYSLNMASAAYSGAYQANLVWLYNLLRATGLFLTCMLFFVFPNGKFNPRWTRWVAVAIAVWMAPYIIALLVPGFLPGMLMDIAWLVLIGLGVALQAYRRQRLSTPEEKQASAPLVTGAIVALAVYLVNFLLTRFFIAFLLTISAQWWYSLIAELVLDAALFFFGFELVRAMNKVE